jgi:UDP-N-acetylglucosamine diphosphorylase/glucosamine-1-phosphate N-acetyltransferase
MNYILFDDNVRYGLLPFTHTRPVADIRCGILTMRHRWEHYIGAPTSTLTETYLQEVYPLTTTGDDLLINGSVFVNSELLAAIQQLQKGQKLVKGDTIIAAYTSTAISFNDWEQNTSGLTTIEYTGTIQQLSHIWDIFAMNDYAIRADFEALTAGRTTQPIPEGVTVSGKANLFIEEGAKIYPGCIINAETGPVYLAKDAEILEGTMIRGPLALGEHGVIKMGAKIYGATTIGPGCKVGGEISNMVMFANSNKGHDGYLGNAVIGEWCNLGADTNSSNLKNNYDSVEVWSEHKSTYIKTGLTFCGLMMGDHSKCGINTMFNTGTVVGVSCNIYGSDFPKKAIPSFSWGSSENMYAYKLDKAMDTAGRMMARRQQTLSPAEKEMYRHIFDITSNQRKSSL